MAANEDIARQNLINHMLESEVKWTVITKKLQQIVYIKEREEKWLYRT